MHLTDAMVPLGALPDMLFGHGPTQSRPTVQDHRTS